MKKDGRGGSKREERKRGTQRKTKQRKKAIVYRT